MGESYKDSPMVGVPGFEPGASWTRTKRDTKLRHTRKAAVRSELTGQLLYITTPVKIMQALFEKNLKNFWRASPGAGEGRLGQSSKEKISSTVHPKTWAMSMASFREGL